MKGVNIIWFSYQGWELGLTSSDMHWHFLVKAQNNLPLSEWRKISTIFLDSPSLFSQQTNIQNVSSEGTCTFQHFYVVFLFCGWFPRRHVDANQYDSHSVWLGSPQFSELQFIKELWLRRDLFWFWYFCQFL